VDGAGRLRGEHHRAARLPHAGDKVLVRIHVRARGAGSGIEVAAGGWNVWTLSDDGLMTRVEVFSGHQEAEALEAAGLSE
jgi:hypothetical protein